MKYPPPTILTLRLVPAVPYPGGAVLGPAPETVKDIFGAVAITASKVAVGNTLPPPVTVMVSGPHPAPLGAGTNELL